MESCLVAAARVAEAESKLLVSAALWPHHVLRPLSPPVLNRHPGLHPTPHDLTLPNKDDYNYIPRILYRTLLHSSFIVFPVVFSSIANCLI